MGTVKVGAWDSNSDVDGVALDHKGTVFAQRPTTKPTNALFSGNLGPTETSRINANGSATFAGNVDAYGYVSKGNSSATNIWTGYHIDGVTNPITSTIKADGSASFSGGKAEITSLGTVAVGVTSGSSLVWSGATAGGGSTSNITGSGSASFAGDIISNSSYQGGSGQAGVKLLPTGTVQASSVSDPVFQGYTKGNAAATTTISAAGTITAKGYSMASLAQL